MGKWNGNKFYKVRVSGPMDKNHIIRACAQKRMQPVCDHHAYRDAYCFDSRKNLHFSHPHHDRHLRWPVSKARGIFWYTGRHGHGSLLNTGRTHRWRNGNDRNGFTMCTPKKGGGAMRSSFRVINRGISHFAQWCSSGGSKIVAGDFNGDGKGDVACTGVRGWRTIPTAFGDGNGGYRVTNHHVPNFPQWASSGGAQMVAGDFNGDGKTDLALMGPRGWATSPIAFSNGNGQYRVTNHRVAHMASWATTPGVKFLAADFNGDGKCDIALAGGRGWATLPVGFSNGHGSFSVRNNRIAHMASWCASGGAKIVAGDFNGDRKADVACTGVRGWRTIPTAFGNGAGSFHVTNRRVHNFPQWATSGGAQMVAGDFNGDGKDDLALDGPRGWGTTPIAYSTSGGNYKVTNNRISHFAGWAATPGAKLLAGKFNKDNKADVALAGGRGWRSLPTAITK
jgi:hypothetical protein